MMLNRYVLCLFIASILSTGAMYLVITKLDPFTDANLALPLFFVSFFFLISSFLTLIGYFLRLLLYRYEFSINHFNISLRQGCLLGLGISGLIGLHIMRTLGLLNALLIIGITIFLELYFVAKE